jgi:TP901 family phage tail tape measure protein
MAFSVSWIYEIIDKYSTPLKKIAGATAKVKNLAKRTSAVFSNLGSKLTGLQNIVVGLGGFAALAFPIKKAMDFEDVMLDIKKVVKFKSPDQFKKTRESIFKTAFELGKIPKNIADIVVQGGKLNVLPKNLGKFTKIVGRTATAFDMLERSAGEMLGNIKTKLGLTMPGVENIMDAINFLADNTATTGKRAVEIVARAGLELKGIKMPPQLIAGWAAFADQIEVTPELAASRLSMMIRRMQKMPGMMRKLLKDPSKAIQDVFEKFGKMPEASRTRRILKKFGDEAGVFVVKAVASQKLLKKTLALVGKGSKFAGSMLRELKIKLTAASTSIGKVRAVADYAFISLGEAFFPVIREFTPKIVKIVKKLTEFFKLNPVLAKMLLGFAAIAGSLAIMGIAVGLIASALGLILSPVTLILIAVGAIGAGFVYLYKRSKFLREGVKRIWEELEPSREAISKVIDDFKKLIETIFGTGKASSFLANSFGSVLHAIATDLKYITGLMKGIIDMFKMIKRARPYAPPSPEKMAKRGIRPLVDPVKLLVSPFKAAVTDIGLLWKGYKTTVEFLSKGIEKTGIFKPIVPEKFDITKEILKGIPHLGTLLTTSIEKAKINVSADHAALSKVEINGKIEVAALKGSEITDSFFETDAKAGNLGLNMAY